MKIIFVFSLFFIASSLGAQEAAPLPPEEKFSAITQFASGKTEYDFKDIIPFDKTIDVPKKSYIKVITQKRCVAVLYENTKVQTPIDRVSPWKILSGSVRWICPEDKIERIIYKDSEVQIQNGEVLITNNQMTVFKNTVRSDEKALSKNTTYLYKNKKWLPLSNQPHAYDLWKKQEKYPTPLESVNLKTEKPQNPYVTRVFLTVAPLGFSGLHHHEHKDILSDYAMTSHAFRLGTNFPWKKKSIIAFIEYNQGESNDRHSGSGPAPIGYESIRFEATTLGLGLRHNHVNSSSYYYYAGLTRKEIEFHLRPETNEYYDGRLIYNFNATVGGGYQKIFWPTNWISLVLGIDFKIIQSLTKGKVDHFNQPFGENRDPRGLTTEYAGLVYFGPTFNF